MWRKGNPCALLVGKLVQPLWKSVWKFLKKLKIELPYDLAIPLLGIYLMKTLIWKDMFTSVFIAALFTMAKTWKQPKCPSIDRRIKKMCYIYRNIGLYIYVCIYIYLYIGLLLSHKKGWNFAICNNMDGLGGYYAWWNKSGRERQILRFT